MLEHPEPKMGLCKQEMFFILKRQRLRIRRSVMVCLVNNCQGMATGDITIPCSSVGGDTNYVLIGAETIISLGEANTIPCLYCCSLSDSEYLRGLST